MKFSTRAIYGMRAMLALAREHGRGSMFLKDIAEQERLPATYMEQLMVPLRKANIVLAVRGARGGYTLARHPSEITVKELLEALEGPLSLSDCPGGSGCCGHPERCILENLWSEASAAMIKVFQDATLGSLLEKEQSPLLNYSI